MITMNHTATHRSKVVRVTLGVAASIGFATLTACGSTAKSSQEVDTVAPAISVVSDTVSLPTDVAATSTSSPVPTTTVASAVTATTTTITATTPLKVAAVPSGVAAVAVIDPALAQALKDAEALLGANGQDLNDAATAAANGG